MDNLVNFEKIDDKLLDKNVYRIYSLDKFLISLNEKSLHLMKPKLWDDPFEGFFLDQAFWRSVQKPEGWTMFGRLECLNSFYMYIKVLT